MPEISTEVFRDLLKAAHLPGAQFAGVAPDGHIWSHAIGIANVETSAPVMTNTKFVAASLSKPVFAYLVLKLLEEGELAAEFLDQPLYAFLPSYEPLATARKERLDQSAEGRSITARLVLSHRTGLPNWVKPDEKLEHSFKPGAGFDYSGEGYRYLQKVIEKITGKTLEQLTKKFVFADLGMLDSSFERSASDVVAVGHDEMGKLRPGPSEMPANAGASLHTTASDYALFLKACIANKNFQQAFSTPTVLMTEDQKAIGIPKDRLRSLAWSLGWGLQSTDGKWFTAFHWGDSPNYKAFTAINFRTGAALVYFVNSENGLAIAHNVVNLNPSVGPTNIALDYLFDKYGFEPYTPHWERRRVLIIEGEAAETKGDYRSARRLFREVLALYPKNQMLQRRVKWVDDLLQVQTIPVRLKAEKLRAFIGHYWSAQISLDAKSGQLRFVLGEQSYNLIPLSANTFAADKDATCQFQFIMDSEGRPMKLVHRFLNGGEAVVSRRIVNPDILQHTLDLLRKHFFPADVAIDENSIIFLSDPRRRNLLLRIPIQSTSSSVPRSIILKQSLPSSEDGDAQTYSRFSRDWAGLEFANSLKQSIHNVPQFYGGDKEYRFILLEDLGEQHISLVDSLLQPNRHRAVAALERYMKALGSFHAASFGYTADYEKTLKTIDEKATTAQDDLEAKANELLPRLEKTCKTLDIPMSKDFTDEIQQVLESIFKPGPFTVLAHGDIAPDNVFDHEGPKGLQLIDFEWSFPRNALLDGTYLRMCIPTGWCAKAIPDEMIKHLELIYRKELEKAIPSASDHKAFASAYTHACGFHALHEMAHLIYFLEKDAQFSSGPTPKNWLWSHETNLARPRFLSRLQAFIDVATEYKLLPNLREMAQNMLAKVKKLWPETTKPLDFYPAFQTPILGLSHCAGARGFFRSVPSEKQLRHAASTPSVSANVKKLVI